MALLNPCLATTLLWVGFAWTLHGQHFLQTVSQSFWRCVETRNYRVYKKTEQIRNRSQRRETVQTIKFMIKIDCLGTYDVE